MERVTLKPKEVTQRYGIPIQSLANDRHKRRGIPWIKKGKAVYYMISDIENYMQSKRIVPNS